MSGGPGPSRRSTGSRRPVKSALFVFAHADDEVAASTRIAFELERGHEVHCVFLTDGTAGGSDARVRDRESTAVLGRLGVPANGLSFLGTEHAIPDGELALHLEPVDRLLHEALRNRAIQRIYCLAYEGGHPDHDASHLLAVTLARRRGLLARTWQVPFYNGRRLPWKLFRVHHPLPLPTRRVDRRLPPGLAARHAFLWLGYPSQWRTWLGLAPDLVWKRAVLRRETLQAVDAALLARRPHPGPLLYERLLDFPYDTFRRAAERFVARCGV